MKDGPVSLETAVETYLTADSPGARTFGRILATGVTTTLEDFIKSEMERPGEADRDWRATQLMYAFTYLFAATVSGVFGTESGGAPDPDTPHGQHGIKLLVETYGKSLEANWRSRRKVWNK